MTDLEHKQKKAADMEAGNERSYGEIQEIIPTFTMDTSDLRRELFIKKMVEWGIVTEEQKLDFEIQFHAEVEEALNGTWEQVRAAQAAKSKKKLTVVKSTAAKLLGPNGQPIGD